MKAGVIGAERIGKVHIKNISMYIPEVETKTVLMAAAATKSDEEGRPVKITEVE